MAAPVPLALWTSLSSNDDSQVLVVGHLATLDAGVPIGGDHCLAVLPLVEKVRDHFVTVRNGLRGLGGSADAQAILKTCDGLSCDIPGGLLARTLASRYCTECSISSESSCVPVLLCLVASQLRLDAQTSDSL